MVTYYETKKKRARHGFHYQMELNFDSEDVKRSFLLRMERAKERLAPSGSLPLDNRELLSSLLDMAEAMPTPPTNQPDCLTTTGGQQQTVPTLPMAMLDNSGLSV